MSSTTFSTTSSRWLPYDAAVFPTETPGARGRCMHPSCDAAALVMRGARTPSGGQDSRRWIAYCRRHGAMYGVLVRRGAVVNRLGR